MEGGVATVTLSGCYFGVWLGWDFFLFMLHGSLQGIDRLNDMFCIILHDILYNMLHEVLTDILQDSDRFNYVFCIMLHDISYNMLHANNDQGFIVHHH